MSKYNRNVLLKKKGKEEKGMDGGDWKEDKDKERWKIEGVKGYKERDYNGRKEK